MLDVIVSVFLLIGAAFALIGSLGLAKLPDVFTRLHGPTKATTLGLGGMLIAAAIYASATGELSLRPVLITIFLFITAPISGHLIARAAMQRRLQSIAPIPEDASAEKRDD